MQTSEREVTFTNICGARKSDENGTEATIVEGK
jgi:hypothetical protein